MFDLKTVLSVPNVTVFADTAVVTPFVPRCKNVAEPLIVLLVEPSEISKEVDIVFVPMAKIRPLAPTVTTGMAVVEPYEPAERPGTAFKEAFNTTSAPPLKA